MLTARALARLRVNITTRVTVGFRAMVKCRERIKVRFGVRVRVPFLRSVFFSACTHSFAMTAGAPYIYAASFPKGFCTQIPLLRMVHVRGKLI